MADNLPIIKTCQEFAASNTTTTTLLGRGIAAIQQKQMTIADQDKRYRQARDVYNQITDFGWELRFNPDLLPKQGEQLDLFADKASNELQPLFDKINQLSRVFRRLKQLADEGYGKVYFLLARMYRGGQGVTKNIEKSEYYDNLAFRWHSNHHASNDPEIQRDLAWMYECGFGTNKDQEKAVFWYEQAAEQGYADAQFNLGLMYRNGRGVEQNDEQAVFWHERAAEQGHAMAQCNLGLMYDEDEEQAVFWYRKAAEQGHADAQDFLGLMYQHGHGVEQDCDQAVFWYSKAAEQGHAQAQCNLGWMYEEGHGIEQDDEQAVFWFEQAAEQGDARAQCNLGRMYANGCGIEQDDEQAVFWFEQAAEQGDADAQFNLGLMKEQAVFWYRKAAEQGHADAQDCLGSMYQHGHGVEQDCDQAVFWYSKAAEQGHALAKNNLDWMYIILIRSEEHPTQFLMKRFGITDIQAEAILEIKLSHLAKLEDMIHLLTGQPNDWYGFVSHFGYGFKAQLKDLLSTNIADTLFMCLPDGGKGLMPTPIHDEDNLLAIATSRRLLIFPMAELTTLEKEKDKKLIQVSRDYVDYPGRAEDYVVAITAIPESGQLKVWSGKRYLTLKTPDIAHYSGNRANRGIYLPRGFQRIDSLECE